MKKVIVITCSIVISLLVALYAYEYVDADKIQRIQNDGYYSLNDLVTFSTTGGVVSKYFLLMSSGNNYVAIGSNANSNVMMSVRGTYWSNSGFLPQYNYKAGTYGNGMYVVWPTNNTTNFTSTDGFTWTACTTPTLAANWFAMAYSPDKKQFVAVAPNTNLKAVSTNPAVEWFTNTTTIANDMLDCVDVTYGWNAAGTGIWSVAAMTNRNIWSLNGTNWFTNGGSLDLTNWISVAGGSNKFIKINGNTNTFAFSVDGSNFFTNTLTNGGTHLFNPTCIRYNAGYFYMTLANTNIMLYAQESNATTTNCTNGEGWKHITLPSVQWWSRIAFGNSGMVVMATNGITATFASLGGSGYQSQISASAVTNIYYLIKTEFPAFGNRAICQIEILNTNVAGRSAVGCSVYSGAKLLSATLSNRYVVASNDLVLSSWLPGKRDINYGAWKETQSNAFMLASIGNLVFTDEYGHANADAYGMPFYMSNNMYYVVELSNATGVANSQKIIIHFFR